MIKFYRHIRKTLLEQNKMGQYFKYALGEILLVVLGILIAVQINAYVSQKKLVSDNKVFLNKMTSELELNKKRMRFLAIEGIPEQGIPGLKQIIQNCDTILKLSYVGFQEKDFPFVKKTRLNVGRTFLNLHTSIYEELLNTGKLYSLASDSLITDIKNYYNRIQREDLYNKENSKVIAKGQDLLRNNISAILLDIQFDKSFSIKNYPWYFDRTSKSYKDFQKGVALMRSGQTNNYRKMLQIITYSDSLIVKIKKELND